MLRWYTFNMLCNMLDDFETIQNDYLKISPISLEELSGYRYSPVVYLHTAHKKILVEMVQVEPMFKFLEVNLHPRNLIDKKGRKVYIKTSTNPSTKFYKYNKQDYLRSWFITIK